MKSIQQAMIEEIYIQADKTAKQTQQTVGEKREFYITLQQLEMILERFTK